MDEQNTTTPPAEETPPTDTPQEGQGAAAAPPAAPPVTEVAGEVIADDDPQALPKLRQRETRLSGELETARTEAQQLRDQLAEQETKMTDANESLTNLTQERDTARAEAEQLRTQLALAGKVVDPVAAARLIGADYRTADGAVDVDAFLTSHPYMRPANPAPTAPNGGGDAQVTTTKEAEIEALNKQLEAAQKAGNRVLAVSLQSKLTELARQ